MTIYRCVILEDDDIAQKILETNIKRLPHLEIVQVFSNPIEAIPLLHQGRVDILFSDVEMPEISGLDLIKTLEAPPQIILTTSHSDYSMEAFDVGVTDYLLKPFSFERFLKAVNRAIDTINIKNKASQKPVVQEEQIIFLKAGRESLKFFVNDIQYIEALGAYTRVFSKEKPVLISESISDLQIKLQPLNFIRVHKSYLVPRFKVTGISSRHVILDKLKIPLGVSYRETIEKLFEEKSGS
ncbi:LytR/AlgR family response regulator transcription factor [Flectobacillus longus]|jgi:DNA-binding LytR/AlgR family response regulator|uniref:LytTR family DNA-binding domain-containing protein n=1 Tax=Flectobacillus longus TaxID=2984207 RepID=A0ABT6YMA8_9BACT|nr:LytTR family DNA-binding domain-containing protein [Flectobacillus longus]MDI9864739.1 LytTR family DNA-binding domain-containing protein [Flectobacillus longus]MDI9880372.1 LytTR family DNA-binding domain-containing protein [Flectobacillus longus]